jgi:hypothetical protein
MTTYERPWNSISMYYISGLPSTKHGNDCVFVILDQFYKMVVLTPCKKRNTVEATTNIFFEHVWVLFEFPRTLVLDQYSNFLSIFWSSLWSMMETKKTKLTPFHPKTNGKT